MRYRCAFFQSWTSLALERSWTRSAVAWVLWPSVLRCPYGACSLIAVYEGYYATPTAEGVGRATTRTVVTSAVVILFLDYLITAAFL